ncbi:OLC1v1020219C1 [Oldenlandia corymbosa var. corymbosa]|uniref:OLC1v1020219C1 n=1 Tax=Oldenlandia corymbosa var. corymbosa TaxID=529605 RepID=A0AAV1EFU7_OLDCO|nr:OLC1v1020219C1 [Oldenlandia corymbosa var. corymbosa]
MVHPADAHALQQAIWRSLKGKRYLIFLDDMWDFDALGGSFPDDHMGSRIILTSRQSDVAPPALLDQEPYDLCPLNQVLSLELIEKRLSPRNGWTPELRGLGMQIAKKCHGLPLTICITTGLLANIEPSCWREVPDGLKSGDTSIATQCWSTLEVSCKHLPDNLKACFLYFVVFSEDQEVSVRRLLRLWMAEGFVRKNTSMRLEDVAEGYLNDLVRRSLIMVAKRRSDGGIKTCRIHDLLYEFCLKKAKSKKFFHLLKRCGELSVPHEPRNFRRLCITFKVEDFEDSKFFCPRARTLLFNVPEERKWMRKAHFLNLSSIIHSFKNLRVLDSEEVRLHNGFPHGIELLVQLAFLAIRGGIEVIPSSIAKLSILETLILFVDAADCTLSLPDSMWNLQRLKYIYVRNESSSDGVRLPTKKLDTSSILYKLDRLSGVMILHWDGMEQTMRKFPNIRRLKCRFSTMKVVQKNLTRL